MRKLAMMLVLPLAACASVEERTDSRSGSGFSSQSIDGASGQQAERQQVTMQGMEAVPVITLAGVSGDQAAAANAALDASGATTEVIAGGESYDLRQVEAGGYSFAIADPQDRGGMTQSLMTQVAVRTGCKTTGQSWDGNGQFAMALDCS